MARVLLLLIAVCTVACETRASIGATCTRASECTAPLACQFGRCRAECREQRDCPVGALCLVDGTSGSCALPDDPDCRVSGCMGDLACVGSVCVNLCTSIAECPAGSACVPTSDGRARCARIDDGADGGVPDADVDAGTCRPGACDPVVQLAAGDGFTCARTTSNALWCWGAADSVARGPSPAGCTPEACVTPQPIQIERTPGDVREALDIRWVSARKYGACAAPSTGAVVCWGSSMTSAALGNDGDGRYARAVLRDTTGQLEDVVETHVMERAVLAMHPDHMWAAWGDDRLGQFGGIATSVHTRAMEIDAPLPDATAVRVGNLHACALFAGSVHCWGGNDYAQTGDVETIGGPVEGAWQVPGVSTATELALGDEHTCALLGNGEITCWGERGALGTTVPMNCQPAVDPYQGCAPSIVARPGPAIFEHLATGGAASVMCAIDADGDLWCWGHDWDSADEVPVLVALPRPVTEAVVSWSHICAVAAGEVYCWGQNDWGQLGRETAETGIDPPDPMPGLVVWP